MSEELHAELAAMRRLIEHLAHEIERLARQFDRTEQAARGAALWRVRDDEDEGSD